MNRPLETAEGRRLLPEVPRMAGPLTGTDTGAIAGAFLNETGIDRHVVEAMLRQLTPDARNELVDHAQALIDSAGELDD